MRQLPEPYLEQMKQLLQEDFSAFLKTYEHPPVRSLRVNCLKITPDLFLARVPFHLEPVPWCPEGFYYRHDQDRPGKHVYHAAGLYYIQDASAMAPVEALEPEPGETVLDLCAAPGGKTTQIAAKMHGEGILVANEIDGKRIKALVENLERCGVTNAIVLNEHPERLSERFPNFFDRILIDAPCSGEGMFRKDQDALERWSPRLVEKCAILQNEILEAAAPMLKAGGRLVYSTCTFNPKENEEVIARFLERHPEFTLLSVPQMQYYQAGHPEWAQGDHPQLEKTARLWPHHLKGEGHFVAVLMKTEETSGRKTRMGKETSVPKEALKQWEAFQSDAFRERIIEGPYTLYGDHLYQVPEHFPSLKGLKVERPGRYLGQVKRSHFQPGHALAMSLKPEQVRSVHPFSVDDPELYRYLQGETLTTEEKGWTLVAVDSFSLGWGKGTGGLLKNHYPKFLRWDASMLEK